MSAERISVIFPDTVHEGHTPWESWNARGEYILYVMHNAMRVEENPALDVVCMLTSCRRVVFCL